MRSNLDSATKIAVLNIVLNYILSRRWRDYDDFSTYLTESIIKKSPRTEKELTNLLSKLRSQFFRLNAVSKNDFIRGFPSHRLINAISSRPRFTNRQIEQVHRTIQKWKPNVERLYIEDIDSFRKVKTITREQVLNTVPVNVSEDFVKNSMCKILSEPTVPKDWPGERSDLYTNVKYRGRSIPAAFMFKGKGTQGKLTIRKCGKNGDQILRLVEEPARLFVVQHIDVIDSNVIRLLEIAVGSIAKEVQKLYYCVMDGVETARLLLAYGFLNVKPLK